MWPFLRRLLSVYWAHGIRRAVGVSLLLLAVTEILGLVSPYVFGKIVSSLTAQKPMAYLIKIALIAFSVQLVSIGISYLKDWYELKHLDFRIENALAKQTFDKLLSLSIGQHRNENSGLTDGVIKDGASSLAQLASMVIYGIAPFITQSIVVIAAIFWYDSLMGCIITIGVMGFVGLIIWNNKASRQDLKLNQKKWRQIGQFHSEILRNLFLVIMNGQEERIANDYTSKREETCNFSRLVWLRMCQWSSLRGGFTTFIRYAALLIGIWRMTNGKYDAGQLVMLWLWTGSALSPLEQLNRMSRQIFDLAEKTKKYFSLLDVKPAVVVASNPIHPEKINGNIVFRNVGFQYPTDRYIEQEEEDGNKTTDKKPKQILKGVSFEIKSGERVALVGPSGAGKSTIISLLMRCYDPDCGQILIDGHDLRLLDPQILRKAMGVVEQDVRLFDETLRYNIVFGLNGRGSSVTDEELNVLAKTTRIHKFFDRLTEGFDTKIGEQGVKLSGGERQRVGIARALIKDPRILILDEATSHLDAVNEAGIQEAIEEASTGRTTVMIAHRLSTVIGADNIIVVNDGQVIAQGTHNELRESCELYATLVQTQLCS